ncbi:type II toxin-antitoxin system toxin ribonuclease VapC11 [soil metagenome]
MDVLIDTSVWVSYLRGDGGRAHGWLRGQIATPESLVTTEPVVMELLAGAPPGGARQTLEDVLVGMRTASVVSDTDFRAAGLLAQAVRRHGRTIRSIVDCLIAGVALRADITLAHRDADFDAIAAVAPLRTIDLR